MVQFKYGGACFALLIQATAAQNPASSSSASGTSHSGSLESHSSKLSTSSSNPAHTNISSWSPFSSQSLSSTVMVTVITESLTSLSGSRTQSSSGSAHVSNVPSSSIALSTTSGLPSQTASVSTTSQSASTSPIITIIPGGPLATSTASAVSSQVKGASSIVAALQADPTNTELAQQAERELSSAKDAVEAAAAITLAALLLGAFTTLASAIGGAEAAAAALAAGGAVNVAATVAALASAMAAVDAALAEVERLSQEPEDPDDPEDSTSKGESTTDESSSTKQSSTSSSTSSSSSSSSSSIYQPTVTITYPEENYIQEDVTIPSIPYADPMTDVVTFGGMVIYCDTNLSSSPFSSTVMTSSGSMSLNSSAVSNQPASTTSLISTMSESSSIPSSGISSTLAPSTSKDSSSITTFVTSTLSSSESRSTTTSTSVSPSSTAGSVAPDVTVTTMSATPSCVHGYATPSMHAIVSAPAGVESINIHVPAADQEGTSWTLGFSPGFGVNPFDNVNSWQVKVDIQGKGGSPNIVSSGSAGQEIKWDTPNNAHNTVIQLLFKDGLDTQTYGIDLLGPSKACMPTSCNSPPTTTVRNGALCTINACSNDVICNPTSTPTPNPAGTNVHAVNGCVSINESPRCDKDDGYNVANTNQPYAHVPLYAGFNSSYTKAGDVQPGCSLEANWPANYGDIYFHADDGCLYDSSRK
ncbi:hypothetical protein F4779DRAFT_52436 [Xylariaceae sp. FL0662B]|nr:hypothetical protein F4779DRAFT_52436 [Xylariaceae sp. FL0662B]